MKRILIIFLCLFLLSGCKDKVLDEEVNEPVENYILEKVDNEKDIVYRSNYKKLVYEEKEYNLDNVILNIKSEDADNINLEIRSFVNRSYKDMELNDNILIRGNIIDYDYYITDKYVSIIQRYYPYINGTIGEEEDNVYVISLETGKLLDNKKILEIYNYNEEQLFTILENKIDSEDILYTIMNIKNNGYKLYIKEDKLNVIYYEKSDDDSIRKELVLN